MKLHIARDDTSAMVRHLLALLVVSAAVFAAAGQDTIESQTKATCSKVCSEANQLLENGDAERLLAQVQIHGSRCVCLEALARDAAEYFYQRAVEARRNGDFVGALAELRIAVRFDPTHSLAVSSIEGVQGQLKAAAEKLLQQWHSDIAAGQFGLAANIYRQITITNTDYSSQILERMRAGYRQQLASTIQLWNEGCAKDDALLMDRARRRAAEVIPDPEFGEEMIAEWMMCERKP